MCYKNRSFAGYVAVDPSVRILFVSGRACRLLPPSLAARPPFFPLFSRVRGRGVLRTSPKTDSRKFAFRNIHLAEQRLSTWQMYRPLELASL
jgi:hypothetical protein